MSLCSRAELGDRCPKARCRSSCPAASSWPNETLWHVAAATEATQGLPAWSLGDYVPNDRLTAWRWLRHEGVRASEHRDPR